MNIKTVALNCLLLTGLFAGHISAQAQPWYIKVADNFLSLYPNWINYTQTTAGAWVYEQGLVEEALFRVYKKSSNAKYYNYVKKHYDYFVQTSGTILTYDASGYRLDDITPGRALISVYKETNTAKYKLGADKLRSQLRTQPRTQGGGFWHKNIYPNQMWLDGLYMASPFYLSYTLNFGDTAAVTDVIKQFELIVAHLRDSTTGLYYHGWDESRTQAWANPVTGCSASFWGRAMGWYIMALIDVIDLLPANHPKRPFLITTFQQLCASLLPYRDTQKKLWYQVVDQGTRAGNYIETSASLMFTYAYLRGANQGYLPSSYYPLGTESFQAVVDSHTTTNGGVMSLLHICQSAGLGGTSNRDGSFAYYISEPQRTNDFKGYGAFILAALELGLTEVRGEESTNPTGYFLEQNYPNPFNPSTRISFFLKQSCSIYLSIFNHLGEEVRQILRGFTNAGNHEVEFDAGDLPSGVYFCRLSGADFSLSKKMVLIR